MLDKYPEIEQKFREIGEAMTQAVSDPKDYAKLAKEYRRLEEIVEVFQKLQSVENEIRGHKEIIQEESDEELLELAKAELPDLENKRAGIEAELTLLLIPPDPRDARDVVVEIRAGTGGVEASLFSADLFRMYRRFSERKHWKLEILSSSPSELGGFKEIIFSISGNSIYSKMKFESGVHRVQRVPETEASGRIHTSAATVAVLLEPEEVDVEVNQEDLKIDVYRSTGAGGQHVNTTDSAVRITHLPTGLVVTCQDERSQIKNRAKALKVLRARLYDIAIKEQEAKEAEMRRQMVSTGDRSAKIRTYNFPQNRITDHRIRLTLYRLEEVLDGDLEELVDALQVAESSQALANLEIED
jgi:peptide chain release factor 1